MCRGKISKLIFEVSVHNLDVLFIYKLCFFFILHSVVVELHTFFDRRVSLPFVLVLLTESSAKENGMLLIVHSMLAIEAWWRSRLTLALVLGGGRDKQN